MQKFNTPRTFPSNPNMQFSAKYEFYIKDTFEAELADACIRIFDLAGLLSLEIWNPPAHLNEPDIPGNIMEAMAEIGICYTSLKDNKSVMCERRQKEKNNSKLRFHLSRVLSIIFAIAKRMDVDLWAHIEAAMKYNRLRESKHGKKY